MIENKIVEVNGHKWRIVVASSESYALAAISYATVRGSNGCSYAETGSSNPDKNGFAEVERIYE